MKKSVKCLIMALSVCAVSAFAVAASGCGGVPQWLEQARCEHKMDGGVVTTEATCTEKGEKTFTCVLCEYTETEEVDILPHTEIELKAVAPTCTKSGLGSGKKCAVCDEILVAQTVLAPTGHKVVTDEAVAPTCTEAGKTEGSHCGNCDLVFVKQETVAAIGHNAVEMEGWDATCEKDGYTGGSRCDNCGEVYTGEVIPAFGHSWGDGEITAEVTCTTDGVKVYTCSTCEETKEEITPAPGHAWDGGVVTTAATCEEDGMKTFTCGTCEITKTQTIVATGHVYEDGSCIVCGEEKPSTGNCFVAGTPVLMADGSVKTIENVAVGDVVLTWNEATKTYDTGAVVRLIRSETTDMARVTFADGTSIEMTALHPIYTQDGWKSLTGYNGYDVLQVGDMALSVNGEYDKIVSIERWTAEESVEVYNLTVEGESNYFAGETSILVHNKGSK